MISATNRADPLTKEQAQRRVEQVQAFERELDELETAGALRLAPDQRSGVRDYHARLLDELGRTFDVDRSEGQRRLSVAMRVASLLGAVMLSAAAVLFFYRVWGVLATPAQIAVLTAVPMLLVAAVELAARREKTLYIASVLALVALVAFVLDVNVLGALFNMRPSPWAFALWAVFAGLLALGYRLPLMLAACALLATAFLTALVATLAGLPVEVALARPEPIVAAGALIVLAGIRVHRTPVRAAEGQPFENASRTLLLVGAIELLLPLVFLSSWPQVFSYATGSPRLVGSCYDVAGFVLPVAGAWLAIRRGWRDVLHVCTGFLILFLYAKCFDWWWAWMPRYLFFLLLGGLAIAALVVLGRLRTRFRQV